MTKPMRRITLIAFLGAFVPLIPDTSYAEALVLPQARQGYYLGASAGLWGGRHNDEDIGAISVRDAVITLRLAEAVNHWFGLGMTVDVGSGGNRRFTESMAGLAMELQLQPLEHLVVRAGAGMGYVSAKDTTKKLEGMRAAGGAYYTTSLSYELFPFYTVGSGGLAVTPAIELRHIPGDSFDTTFIGVSVALGYWLGLDKQALELPVVEAFAR